MKYRILSKTTGRSVRDFWPDFTLDAVYDYFTSIWFLKGIAFGTWRSPDDFDVVDENGDKINLNRTEKYVCEHLYGHPDLLQLDGIYEIAAHVHQHPTHVNCHRVKA